MGRARRVQREAAARACTPATEALKPHSQGNACGIGRIAYLADGVNVADDVVPHFVVLVLAQSAQSLSDAISTHDQRSISRSTAKAAHSLLNERNQQLGRGLLAQVRRDVAQRLRERHCTQSKQTSKSVESGRRSGVFLQQNGMRLPRTLTTGSTASASRQGATNSRRPACAHQQHPTRDDQAHNDTT